MTRDPFAEWSIDAADFPVRGSDAEKLRFLLKYAILAPSGHNTQPWFFLIEGGRVFVFADRTRCLPVVDPHDRALAISCGAAIGVLRAAARRFGRVAEIELLPEGEHADLLASVGLGASHATTADDRARFEGITKRRSTRLKFAQEPLPSGLAEELVALAALDGVELVVIADEDRKSAVAALVAEGDRAQFADPSFRRELAAWIHSRRAASRDGMSASNFGVPDLLSPVGGLVIRAFDLGERIAAGDEEITAASPALLVVATPGDAPRDWLLAGMAHVTALLAVAAAGLTAAYANQPVEVDVLRPRLRKTAGTRGMPQLLLRIGRAPQVDPAVRRSLEDVLVERRP